MTAITIQRRLRLQIETPIPYLSSLRRLFAAFSYSSSSPANPRLSNSFFDEEDKSAAYGHKLKFQRPSTVRWRLELWNSASFIGTVVQPVRSHESVDLSAYTVLSVRNSPQSKERFRILLQMRDKMAEICFKHLKENDYIYVSGRLGTHAKIDQHGNLRLLYKVLVNELNYVTGRQDSTSKEELQSVEGGLTILEKYTNRLHLWQVFFSSPYEWWDNRKGKTSPNNPDFRHKDTGEALWLSPNDPLWVAKQLQLLDSKMAERGDSGLIGRRARLAKWEYEA